MAPSLLLHSLIHPSAWNRNSANFAVTEFSEVRLCASGPRLLTTEAGGPLLYSPTTKNEPTSF